MAAATVEQQAGPVERSIRAKLREAFAPTTLEVINESHLHNVPPGSEKHFKVVIISDHFAGQNRITRHRAVNRALGDELANGVHALTITSLTPTEWTDRGGVVAPSPRCRGSA